MEGEGRATAPTPGTAGSTMDAEEGATSTATTAASPAPPASRMQQLSAATARALTSGQVISNIKSVVKELVENSLDAGATAIDVKLEDVGLRSITITDNGPGIPKGEVPYCAKKHWTSKLEAFEDLSTLHTYGFRGEALGSICCVGQLSVVSRCAGEVAATRYAMDAAGAITEQRPATFATPSGTSIVVSALFANLPVRRQAMSQPRAKRDRNLAIQDLLTAFSLAHLNVRFSYRCDKPQASWTRHPAADLRTALSARLGPITARSMCTLEATSRTLSAATSDHQGEQDGGQDGDPPDAAQGQHGEAEDLGTAGPGAVTIQGLVPRPDADLKQVTRSANDRCFLYINGRPFTSKAVLRTLKAHMPALKGRNPVLALFFTMDPARFDVNCSPDKMTILFRDEAALLQTLADALDELHGAGEPAADDCASSTMSGLTQPGAPPGLTQSRASQSSASGVPPAAAPAPAATAAPPSASHSPPHSTRNGDKAPNGGLRPATHRPNPYRNPVAPSKAAYASPPDGSPRPTARLLGPRRASSASATDEDDSGGPLRPRGSVTSTRDGRDTPRAAALGGGDAAAVLLSSERSLDAWQRGIPPAAAPPRGERGLLRAQRLGQPQSAVLSAFARARQPLKRTRLARMAAADDDDDDDAFERHARARPRHAPKLRPICIERDMEMEEEKDVADGERWEGIRVVGALPETSEVLVCKTDAADDADDVGDVGDADEGGGEACGGEGASAGSHRYYFLFVRRAQERLLFEKLMAKTRIAAPALTEPLELTQELLGPKAFSRLGDLEDAGGESAFGESTFTLEHQNLRLNGFAVQKRVNIEQGISFWLHGLAHLDSYGVGDLRDVLVHCSADKTAIYRPHKVIGHFRSEAERIARSSNLGTPDKNAKVLRRLLRLSRGQVDVDLSCVHHQPVWQALDAPQPLEPAAPRGLTTTALDNITGP